MNSIDRLDVRGKRVLVRVDFNVPMRKEGDGSWAVADDTRIVQALPTIEELRASGARLVLVSHLGRPEGRPEADLSLAPVAERLRELTGAEVTLAPEVVGPRARALAESLEDGEILLLENVRFEPGETANDPDLARALAELAELYVNDAFGAAHRAHASTAGVAHLLPCAAGRLLEREVSTLTGILESPERPLVAVIGGAKVADKIAVIDRFMTLADAVIIGGAMCFPFLCAEGHKVGESLCDSDDVEHARGALVQADLPGHARLLLAQRPGDRRSFRRGRRAPRPGRRRGAPGLDGSRRRSRHRGPLCRRDSACGYRLLERADGSFRAGAVLGGDAHRGRSCRGRGGRDRGWRGDSAAALARFGLEDRVDHLSTGGGATLELVEGRVLPGVQALQGAGIA